MPTRAVLSSLVVAVVLGLAVAVVLVTDRRDRSESVGEAVLGIKPSLVERIVVTRPDGSRDTIERDGRAWLLRLRDADGSEIVWPVDAGRVAAVVRLLAEAVRSTGRRGDAQQVDDDATGSMRIEILTRDGTVSLDCEPAGVGGSVAIGVTTVGGDEISASADRSVTDLFERSGLRAWRMLRAMPTLTGEASSVMVRSGSMRIELARLGERWAMRVPMSSRADAGRVRRLVASLAAMGIERFHDSLTAEAPETGLAEPAAEVRVEYRTGRGTERFVSILLLGSVADLESKTLFALVLTERIDVQTGERSVVFGPAVVSLDVAQINEISPVPDAYLDRRALGSSAADVRRVVIERDGREPAVFARSIGSWTTGDASGGEKAVDPGDRAMLDRLVAWITEQPAVSASTAIPGEHNAVATVEVFGLDGGSLGRVIVGRANPVIDQGGVTIMLVSEGAARWYEDRAVADLLAWLMAG